MDTLKGKIVALLDERPGLTDKEIAYELRNWVSSEQAVTIQCSRLEDEGILRRIKRIGKPAGNYLAEETKDPTIDLAPEPVDDLPDIPRDAVHIADLRRVGFTHAGDITASSGELVATVHNSTDKSDVLYALLIDDVVVCLGHSPRPLGHTLTLLQTGQAQGETNRYHGYLRNVCLRGSRVEVWILADPGVLQFAGHRISLTAGIYRSLVEHFQPVWTRHAEAA